MADPLPARAASPAGAGPRAILVDPQIYDCLNMGGVAMTQGVVRRLRDRWPDAAVLVLTEDPAALRHVLPDVVPVPYAHMRRWTADRFLLGPLYRVLPEQLARRVIRSQRRAERRFPQAARAAVRARVWTDRAHVDDYRTFMAALSRCGLVVVSGGNGPCELIPAGLRATLSVLDLAAAHGIPTAMVSQGAGEITTPAMRERVCATLAHVGQVLTREGRTAPSRFVDWGVAPAQVAFGADDAIPAAVARRPDRPGDGLGVNLRLAAYTRVGEDDLVRARGVLQAFLRRRGVPPVPVPIALHQRSPDHEVIRALLAGLDDATDGGAGIRRPEEAMAAAGRCRVVVTGAYHAAVFALAQGASVVAVAGSTLYAEKFQGLAHDFGDACRIVASDAPDFQARLAATLDTAWDEAPARRPALLQTADRLAAHNAAAYERILALADAPRAAARPPAHARSPA